MNLHQRKASTVKLIFSRNRIEIWAVTETHGVDYYVYGVLADPIVCASLGAAMERAAR